MADLTLLSESAFNLTYRAGLAGAFSAEALSTDDDAPFDYALMFDEKSTVVALARVFTYSNTLEIGWLETAAHARECGYGTALFNALFRHAAQTRGAVRLTEYTDAGLRHLSKREERLAARYPDLRVERWP